jgi:hypothetical protein
VKEVLIKLYFLVVLAGAVTLSVYGGISLSNKCYGYSLCYALALVILSPVMVLWGYSLVHKTTKENGK